MSIFVSNEIGIILMTDKKILVIQQKMIGDVLTSTVLCEKLKNIYPYCIVHYIANENTLPVLENNPHIDKVIVFEKKYKTSKKAFFKFLKSIRKESYYAIIDAYGKLESNLISKFAKAEYKIAINKWYTQWIYSHTINENLSPNSKVPLAIQNRLQLLSPISNVKNETIYYPKIYLTQTEIRKAEKEVSKIKTRLDQKIIMISILGTSELKTYPANYMAQVLDLISAQSDAKLIFNYIPNQKKEVFSIYQKCKAETQNHIEIDFYAKSLRDFITLLSQCDALLGNEGGAVNMAKALEVPTFCIFSPFILKGAWHSDNLQAHKSVHLKDYKPDALRNMSKKDIKKHIDELYGAFEPKLFEEPLIGFLKQYCI